MQSDKIPLCEAECFSKSQTRTREPAKKNTTRRTSTSTVIFFLILFTFLFICITYWWTWRNLEMIKDKGNDVGKSPFNPPSRDDLAKTARYIAHYMDWCVMSTISIAYNGIPTGIPISIADGPVNNSTGVPYIYVTPYAPSSHDLEQNSSSSFSFSEAMSDYCSRNNYDPEDPRCARLTLAGKVVKLTEDEIPFAKEALFSRHPIMKKWPSGHDFFFAKLDITHVHVLDTFGPSHEVSVKDYFAAKV